jgi:Ca-activated chloride channel family protein
MEQAHRELEDLVGRLRGDAVGLVIFAGGSYVRLPLTVDYDTFLWAVRESETSTIQAQGTSLPGALDAATQLLARGPSDAGRAVVVVSDGEDHGEPTTLDLSLQRARDAGVHVYALGIGTPEGAPIPMDGGGFKKDRNGQVVVSRLEEDVLRRVASSTGGAYVRAVPSDDDVRAIVEDEIRGKLSAGARGVRRERIWRERYQWPLAAGLVAMVITALAGVGRRAVPLALALLCLAPPAHAGPREEGAAAWRAGRWEEAVRSLGQARVTRPDDVELAWMLADSLYRASRPREAERLYEQLAQQDPEHRAEHLYNAGMAAYRGGRLDEALVDLRAAAAAKPDLGPATRNAELVQKEIAARRDPKRPPDSPPPEPKDGGSSPTGTPSDGADSEQQDGADARAPQRAKPSPSDPSPSKPSPSDPSRAPSGGGTPPTDGTRPPSGESGTDDLPQGAEPEQAPPASVPSTSPQAGRMEPQEAARLVESVPDGHPRVVVTGRSTEEDW